MKNLILITLFLSLFAISNGKVQIEHTLLMEDSYLETDKLVNETQSMQLNTDGLYYAEFFDYIFRGHFENVDIGQDDMEFLLIFDSYLRTFGRNCSEYLPEDKVDIMDQECATETVTRNGYGMELSRYCSEWRTVKSNLHARPELYNAQIHLSNMQSADAMRTAVSMMTDPNAVGNSVDLIHKANGLRNDMSQIFQLNPCNSPGIRRFEENLRLFALHKPSIRMEEESKYTTMKTSGGPSGPQNFTKLVDDLVTIQSRTWAFNRYIPGSVTGLTVQSKDNEGRPIALKANYSYKGFGGNSNGWVQVTFINGLPKCIYFFDYPNNCKNPSSSIVASYSKGDYGEM